MTGPVLASARYGRAGPEVADAIAELFIHADVISAAAKVMGFRWIEIACKVPS